MIEQTVEAAIDAWPWIRLFLVVFTWVFVLESIHVACRSLASIERHLRNRTEDEP